MFSSSGEKIIRFSWRLKAKNADSGFRSNSFALFLQLLLTSSVFLPDFIIAQEEKGRIVIGMKAGAVSIEAFFPAFLPFSCFLLVTH